MRTAHTLALVALVVAAPAYAANRCTAPDGRVSYQDAPCDGGASSRHVPTAQDNRPKPGETSPAIEGAKVQCLAAIRGGVPWRDPAAVVVESTIHRIGRQQSIHSTEMVVTYAGRANGVNGFGGRTGMQSYFCEFDTTETTVLRVVPAGY